MSGSVSRLSIPFSIPVLGEAFISVGSPMVTAALDFVVDVRVVRSDDPASVPHPSPLPPPPIPVASPSLRRALARYLSSKGISGSFTVESGYGPGDLNSDYLATTAILYMAGEGEDDPALPQLLSRVRGRDFITLARALTSLSGGFVVSRGGEGAVSLEGIVDASVLLKISPGRRVRGALAAFSQSFPELAGPLWHLVGHLAIEGGRAVSENDASTLGRLLRFEGAILYSLGLVKPGSLSRVSRPGSYGGKVLCSEALGGELLLAPGETLTLPDYSRFHFNPSGVREKKRERAIG